MVPKIEPKAEKESTSQNYNVFYLNNTYDIKSVDELDQKIEENIEFLDGMRYCKLCEYQTKHRGHMKEHIEIHFRMNFQCPHCGNKKKTRYALRRHLKGTKGRCYQKG